MEKTLTQAPFNGKRIVLFGPESTGKTTLSIQLANHYTVAYVPEFMRTYLQHKWDAYGKTSEKKDILPIAIGQLDLENKAVAQGDPFIFCDTNVLEIATYASYYFKGFYSEVITKAIENHHYDHYFLTYIDIPWEADDLRDRPNDRSQLFRIFESVLIKKGVPYTILKGNKQTRLNTAITVIDNLFKR